MSSPLLLTLLLLTLLSTLTLSQTTNNHHIRGVPSSDDDTRWTNGGRRYHKRHYDDDERPIWATMRRANPDTTTDEPSLAAATLTTSRFMKRRNKVPVAAAENDERIRDLTRRIRNKVIRKINHAMGRHLVDNPTIGVTAEPLKRVDDDKRWRGTHKSAPRRRHGYHHDDDEKWKVGRPSRDDDEKWKVGKPPRGLRDDDDEKWRTGRDDDDEKWRTSRNDDEKWRTGDDDQCRCIRAPCNCPGHLKNPLTWKAPRDTDELVGWTGGDRRGHNRERLPFFGGDDDDEFLRRIVSDPLDDDSALLGERLKFFDDDDEDLLNDADEFLEFFTRPIRRLKDKILNPKKKSTPELPEDPVEAVEEDQGNYCTVRDDDTNSDVRIRC